MSADAVIQALGRNRYAPPGWHLVPEVSVWCHDTKRERRADLYAIGLWHTLRYRMVGFEIKVSRGDWLRERKEPEKSAVHRGIVHEWYLAAPKGVARVEELPEGWGFLEIRGNGVWKLRESAVRPCSGWVGSDVFARLLARSIDRHRDAIRAERDRLHAEVDQRVADRIKAAIESAAWDPMVQRRIRRNEERAAEFQRRIVERST